MLKTETMSNNIEALASKTTNHFAVDKSLDPIDELKVKKLFDLLGEQLNNLVAQFIINGELLIDKMQIAANNANAADLANATHTLKGSSSSLGATILADSCESLYQDARNGNLEHALARIDHLSEQFKDAHHTLKVLIKQI